MKKNILIIFSYQNKELAFGIVQNDGVIKNYHRHLSMIDAEILPLLQEISAEYSPLTGVIVYLDDLGGFASSRLIITSLNIYAWAMDISIQSSRRPGAAVSKKNPKQLLRASGPFVRPVAPQYQRGAHITQTKRISKFTIR